MFKNLYCPGDIKCEQWVNSIFPHVLLKLSLILFNKIGYLNSRAGLSGRAVLRRRSAAARLHRSWVRIPRWAWIFVCCECCVLSGISLCDELITRPEASYRLWCVVVCDLETSWMRRSRHTEGGEGRGLLRQKKERRFCDVREFLFRRSTNFK
jgi:hypothetical protein